MFALLDTFKSDNCIVGEVLIYTIYIYNGYDSIQTYNDKYTCQAIAVVLTYTA